VAKYDPLRDYLDGRADDEVQMTFADIERLVGALPESARTHRAWWANDSKVEAHAWRAAGFRVRSVDLAKERVLFSRAPNGRTGTLGTAKALRANSLIRVLADAFYDSMQIQRIAAESGLPLGDVAWERPAIDIWPDVLAVAQEAGLVDSLLDRALVRAPALRDAIEAYRREDVAGQVLDQPAVSEALTVVRTISDEASVAALAVGELDGRPVTVAGCEDATVRVWDLTTGELIGQPIVGHSGPVWAVALGELDGLPIAVTGGEDSTVRILDMAAGAFLGSPLIGHTAPVNSVALGFLGDRLLAVSASDDHTLRLWDLTNGQPVSVLTGHDDWVNGVAFSLLDGQPIVISGSTDETVRVWDIENGRLIHTLTGHTGPVSSVASGFLDGKSIAISGSTDETVRVWDLENGQLYSTLTGHVGRVRAVALGDLDGLPIAISGGDDRTVRLWDLKDRTALGPPLPEHSDKVRALASGVQGGRWFLVSGGDDRTVRVWAAQRDQVEWLSDSPGGEDLLGRRPLAHALATRLRRFQEDEPGTSFLVHIDGQWGTGKSSLLTMLQAELEQEPKWLTIGFNAWRQSRIGAPWWAMLAVLRHDLALSHRPPARVWLRFAESWARFRRAGAPFALAFIVLLIAAAAVFFLLRPQRLTLASSVSIAQGTTALLAALAILWAGALVAGRFLLWDSARGARLFEQSNTNPMQDVTDHFGWLLRKVKHPVVFFIDDLDRCTDAYVVELLETVQTLIRDAAKQPVSQRSRTTAAASFVIAADGAWIRQSFEIAYKDFTPAVAEPGRPLGYLFLDKLFQLRVPVPAVDAARQQDYLAELLRLHPPGQRTDLAAAEERAVRKKVQESSSEAAIIETLRNTSPQIRGRVAASAVDKLTQTAVAASTEHRLQRFAPLLASNPRAIKRFVNDYSILRAVRTLEGNPVDMDPLALWAIIETRWPALADFLRTTPNAIEILGGTEADLETVPPDLRSLFNDSSVRELAEFEHGGPLTPGIIRACCGASFPEMLHVTEGDSVRQDEESSSH
jgi:hypothetical protein